MNNNLRIWLSRVMLAFAGTSLLLTFQNCGQNFKMQSGIATLDSSALAVPQINFSASSELINTPNFNVSFDVLGVNTANIKTLTCEVTGKVAQLCPDKMLALTGLVDGDYQIKVTVEMVSGVKNEAIKTFRKDSTAPVIMVSSMPAAVTNQTSATFNFTATDNLSGVDRSECSLDNAAFAACSAIFTQASLAAGAHNFRIRAFDRATNTSLIFMYNWTVDLTAPTVNLTSMPPAQTNQTTANFSFSGSGIVSYECQLDNAANFTACTSGVAYNSLAAGSHSFRVRGTSAAGNVSAPSVFTWNIDLAPPPAPSLMSNVTNPTALTSVTFTFSTTDIGGSGVANYQCSLDNAAFAICTSPVIRSGLAVGNHTFQVRAADAVGNTSLISNIAWFIDGSGPTIQITGKPARLSFSPNANFTFTATDASGVASIVCGWKSLVSSVTPVNCIGGTANYTGLAPGNYTFVIVARDQTGQETTSEYAWDVDDNVGTPIQFKAVAKSENQTCGITINDTVKCWGFGQLGVLGNGVLNGSSVPVDAIGLTGVKSISPGGARMCAIGSDDLVKCWGVNLNNLLGTGPSNFYQGTPSEVIGLGPSKMVASGTFHSCAITLQNTVKCWGENTVNQLGNNSTINSTSPVDVIGLGPVKSIVASQETTCATTQNNAVRCWGSGLNGVYEVTDLANSTSVALFNNMICATSSSGVVSCGALQNNSLQQLTNHPSLQGAQNLVRANNAVCGIVAGRVKCSNMPAYRASFDTPPAEFATLEGAKSLSMVDGSLCAVTAENYIRCWKADIGNNSLSIALSPVNFPNLIGVRKIASGDGGPVCALTAQNTVKCMGMNNFGQLGNSENQPAMVPVDVPNVSNVKDLAVGTLAACIITNTNTVKCWGSWNGEGFSGTSTLAVDIPGLTDIRGVAMGYNHTCVFDGLGRVKCWGANNYGELGNNTQTSSKTPVDVIGLTGVKAIAAGYSLTCAITANDRVACWGINYYGGLGSGTISSMSLVPVEIPTLTDVTAISMMTTHACALLKTGNVKCWGLSNNGELGNGTTGQSNEPVDVQGLTGIVSIAAAREHTCAVNTTGRFYCWGSNVSGAFGIGNAQSSTIPVLAPATKPVTGIFAGGNYSNYILHSDGTVSVTGNQYPYFVGLAGPIKAR